MKTTKSSCDAKACVCSRQVSPNEANPITILNDACDELGRILKYLHTVTDSMNGDAINPENQQWVLMDCLTWLKGATEQLDGVFMGEDKPELNHALTEAVDKLTHLSRHLNVVADSLNGDAINPENQFWVLMDVLESLEAVEKSVDGVRVTLRDGKDGGQ